MNVRFNYMLFKLKMFCLCEKKVFKKSIKVEVVQRNCRVRAKWCERCSSRCCYRFDGFGTRYLVHFHHVLKPVILIREDIDKLLVHSPILNSEGYERWPHRQEKRSEEVSEASHPLPLGQFPLQFWIRPTYFYLRIKKVI